MPQKPAGFISDEEFDALEGKAQATPGFISDEEADALEMQAPAPRPKKSMLESGISGLADTLTLGFSDELGAGMAAGVAAPFKDETFGQLYDQYLNEHRAHKKAAEEDNPGSYLTGNVAGAVIPAVATGGSSVAPRALGPIGRGLSRGYQALSPAAGRGIISNLARATAMGGVLGAGQSNARPWDSMDKAEEFAGDVVQGGVLGGSMAGLLGAGGAVARNVGSKLKPTAIGSVMLGLPQEAAELYVKNPAAVNAAKPRQEITQDLLGSIGSLKDEVLGGSSTSRKILAEEGAQVPRAELAALADQRADQLAAKSEGVFDDPQIEAAYKWLKNMAQKLRGEEEGASFSANRVKDLVQSTRRPVNFDLKPGQFSPVDDRVRTGFAHDVDQLLKGKSPAYTEQMKGVAKDSALLEEVSGLAGSPQAMDNLLARVQRERAYFPAQKIAELDKRMETNYLQDLKLSQAKEAFQKGPVGPGGSRMVNLYKEIGREMGEKTKLPFAGSIGALTGATVDKYGPAIGKQILDAAAKSRELVNRSDAAQKLGGYLPILKAAIARGPAALVITNQNLLKDPVYRQLMGVGVQPGQP